jgi:hypothetical protein
MTSAERSRRRRPAVVPAALVLIGVFAAGAAAGWWASTRYAPRYAPDIVIAGADAPGGAGASELLAPDVRGLTADAARQVLVDAGLASVTVRTLDRPSVAPEGSVVTQDPAPGAPIAEELTLAVATPAVVPAIVGADVRAAVREVQAIGATVEVRRVYQPDAPIDTVLTVAPAAGAAAPPHVVLTVAGPATTAYLANLPAVSTGCGGEAVAVDGVHYEHALVCPAGDRFVEATYLLNRQAMHLSAVVGQPDVDGDGRSVRFEVIADGKVVASGTLKAGQVRAVDLDTAKVLRLTVRVKAESGPPGGSLALGDARVIAGPDAVASLVNQVVGE